MISEHMFMLIIDISMIDELKKYKERQDAVKDRLSGSYYDNNFVFTKLDKNAGYPTT